jgi:acyl carrier protein
MAAGYPDPVSSTQAGSMKPEKPRMERGEIITYLKAMLHERFGLDAAALSGSTTQEQLGIDSLLMVDMMLDLETGLGFSFASMDLPRNPDLDTIVALVERNLGAEPAG